MRAIVVIAFAGCVTAAKPWRPVSNECRLDIDRGAHTVDDRRYAFPKSRAFVRVPMSEEPRRVVLEAKDCRGSRLEIFSEY